MTHHRKDAKARERAHDPHEPGASSGAESTPHRRSIPGTASAREGYDPGEGTGAGEALKGREARPGRHRRARRRQDGGGGEVA